MPKPPRFRVLFTRLVTDGPDIRATCNGEILEKEWPEESSDPGYHRPLAMRVWESLLMDPSLSRRIATGLCRLKVVEAVEGE